MKRQTAILFVVLLVILLAPFLSFAQEDTGFDVSDLSPLAYIGGVLLTVIGSFFAGRKNAKPGMKRFFAHLRSKFINYSQIDSAVTSLLQTVGLPVKWSMWVSNAVATLVTEVPYYKDANADQKTDVVASVFSKSTSARVASELTGINQSLLVQGFARKRVAKQLTEAWNATLPKGPYVEGGLKP